MEPISFDLNGFPKNLRTESACKKAIDNKSLKPDTPVLAYDESGARKRILAKDHPVLSPLFDLEDEAVPEEEKAERPDEASEARSDDAAGETLRDLPESADLPPVTTSTRDRAKADSDESEEATAQHAGSDTDPAPAPPRPSVERPWLIPAVIGGVAVVSLMTFNATKDSDQGDADTSSAAVNDGAATEAEATTAAPAPNAEPESLDRSTAGDFGTIRSTQIYRQPGQDPVRSLGAGSKFFVEGTVERYAYGTDENGYQGYVWWGDINANPFDNNEYEFVFQNSTNEDIYLLVTYKVGGIWKVQSIIIPPFEYNKVLHVDDRIASVDSLEAYYYRVNSRERWTRLSAATERTVRDPGANEPVSKMTMVVPQIENNRAIIRF